MFLFYSAAPRSLQTPAHYLSCFYILFYLYYIILYYIMLYYVILYYIIIYYIIFHPTPDLRILLRINNKEQRNWAWKASMVTVGGWKNETTCITLMYFDLHVKWRRKFGNQGCFGELFLLMQCPWKGKKCKVGKKSEQLLIILFLRNALVENKLPPIVG